MTYPTDPAYAAPPPPGRDSANRTPRISTSIGLAAVAAACALGIPAVDASAPHPQSHIEMVPTTTTRSTTTWVPTPSTRVRFPVEDRASMEWLKNCARERRAANPGMPGSQAWNDCTAYGAVTETVTTKVPVPTTTEIVNNRDVVIPAPPRPMWVKTSMFGLVWLALAALLGALTSFAAYFRSRPVHAVNNGAHGTAANAARENYTQHRAQRDVPPSDGNFGGVQNYPETPVQQIPTHPADTVSNTSAEFAEDSTDTDGWGL